MKETIFLGVGTNLGNREQHIRMAVVAVLVFMDNVTQSGVYETLPRYNEEQPRFLNCVLKGETDLDPRELLGRLQAIEDSAGRDRASSGWMGPRPLDIDILLYGNRQIASPQLVIPHPRIKERKFVLVPLLELDPHLRDPGTNEQYIDFLKHLGPQGIYYHVSNSV